MGNTKSADLQTNYSRSDILDLIEQRFGRDRRPKNFKIVTDTSDFFRVDYHDVLIIGDRPYWIGNYEKEGRFGLDDEPKYWVRRAYDLLEGGQKIIKLVFHEEINALVGDMVFRCVRSPIKEAEILDLVRGHPGFMQGYSVKDPAGNIVRIIDRITGRAIDQYVFKLISGNSHEEYFRKHLPELYEVYIEMVRAIKFLHDHGHKHGDIRRDHIFREIDTGNYKWIDFDYDYHHEANLFGYDIFGLGNILIYLVGGGDVTTQTLVEQQSPLPDRLVQEDMNIVFNNRLANLQKLYPYIPDDLNLILLHFSQKAEVFYDNTDELLVELEEARWYET